MNNIDIPRSNVEISRLLGIPTGIISEELAGLYGSRVLQDMYNIIKLYEVYDKGADYPKDSSKDYTPADLRFKTTRSHIDKEARFLFSKPPDFYVDADLGDTKESRTATKKVMSEYKTLIDTVLDKNNFNSILLKAAKDCFIGKRVALMFNINEDTGIHISFLPSLEFVYDVDPNDSNKLTKIVAFYGLNDAKSKVDQRIYKKKYWMDGDFCWYSEKVYDGRGQEVETISEDTKTLFSYIPAWVILNDGLTGDLMGESEVEQLMDYESWYSRMAAGDMDAERTGMNPIRYSIDASPESTQNLSRSAGAYWDLSSDQNQAVDRAAQVGTLDSPMAYSPALSTTLDRIKSMSHEQCAVPNVSPEALHGIVTSGKTLKAIYWDLIVRCDEKMIAWRPALRFLANCIIDGVKLYPKAGKLYMDKPLSDLSYTIRVDNQYPLPEDEQEEKGTDLAEVNAQTMSKKAYMKKWRNLDDDEADEELRQIALERELLEDSFMMPTEKVPTEPKEAEEDLEKAKKEKTKRKEEALNE